MHEKNCKNFHYKKKKSRKNSDRTNRKSRLYKSRFKSLNVENYSKNEASYKDPNTDNMLVDHNAPIEALDCYENYEYVVNSEVLLSKQSLNVYYDKNNRITSYTVNIKPLCDLDSQDSVELDPTEANAVDILAKFNNIDEKGINWENSQEMINIKYCNFKLPPEDLAITYLQCQKCKTKPSYTKISNLVLASKFGQFDELYEVVNEDMKAEIPSKTRSKTKRESSNTGIEKVDLSKKCNKKKTRKRLNKKTKQNSQKEKINKPKVEEVSNNKEILRNFNSALVDDNKEFESLVESTFQMRPKDPLASIDGPMGSVNNKSKLNHMDISMLSIEDKHVIKKPKIVKEKKFVCGSCEKSFTSAYGRNYHVKNIHTLEKESAIKPFLCPFEGCQKKYKNNNGLKYHLRRQHDKEHSKCK